MRKNTYNIYKAINPIRQHKLCSKKKTERTFQFVNKNPNDPSQQHCQHCPIFQHCQATKLSVCVIPQTIDC